MTRSVPKKIIQAEIPKISRVYEISRLTDDLDARPIRIMQNSDCFIQPMALEPTVCKRLGICRAGARDPYTQR